MQGDGIVVVIPAYNPDQKLAELASQLLSLGFCVLVVDDGSDLAESIELLKQLDERVALVHHGVNMGKGAAIKSSLRFLLEDRPAPFGDRVFTGFITADSDGKHSVEDIVLVAEKLSQPGVRFVKGNRIFDGRVPKIIRFGNSMTRRVFFTRTGLRLKDTQAGLRGFDWALLPELAKIEGKRYEYEINTLLWAAENKIAIDEVEIFIDYTNHRPMAHFHVVRDSLLIYSRLLKFTAVSFTAFLLDYFLLMLISGAAAAMPKYAALLVSVAGARLVSSTYSYLVNRLLVFRSDVKVQVSLLQYYLLAAIMAASSYILIIPVSELFGMFMLKPLWIAKPIVDGLLFVINYYVQSRHIFKRKEDKTADD